jgi:hypothetical protein
MINRKINLTIIKNNPDEGFELYLNILVNVVVGYLLDKGYMLKYATDENNHIQAMVYLENVIISLRSGL